MGLALPLLAFGQAPVVPPGSKPKAAETTPVWQGPDHTSLSLITAGNAPAPTVPAGAATFPSMDARAQSTRAGLRLDTAPGIYAHAGVGAIRWTPETPDCTPAMREAAACANVLPQAGVQRSEIGAGYAGHGVKLDLSVGQSQTQSSVSPLASRLAGAAVLPRVLPGEAGADIAAPLWFGNSTSTSISAHGEVRVAPGTKLDLGASRGRVHFLPGSGVADGDDLDQTTLSLGIAHGPVSGAIVGHVLEPALPGSLPYANQRWSGIDLGISVRLPWRGELNFGAQNVWTSGKSPLLLGPADAPQDQGRVPYVQYHQDL